MTALARPRRRPGLLRRGLALARTALLGTLLCLGPVTSVIALGWLTRRMTARILAAFGAATDPPGWLLGPRGSGRAGRALGGLGANIRTGAAAAAGLFLATLPFTGLWLVAWWAGWQNSFHKGYEYAGVGPLLFLAATALAALVVPLLPLALAHMAAEERLAAMAELRRLASVARHAGWRLPALALLTVALALPHLLLRAFPTVAHEFMPDPAAMNPEDLAALAGQLDLAGAGWAFLALLALRDAAARIYVRAAPGAAAENPGLWAGSRAAAVARPGRRPVLAARALYGALSAGAGLVFAGIVLVAQFLNYGWWYWLAHPFLTLPWPG